MEKGAKKTWWIFLLLALVTLGVYLPSVQFGYVDYDDPAYISGNPYVKQGLSADSVRWAWTYAASAAQIKEGLYEGVTNLWHPLSWMSHMLDADIWGMDSPGGHHLTSVLLHLASVLLVYLVFARLVWLPVGRPVHRLVICGASLACRASGLVICPQGSAQLPVHVQLTVCIPENTCSSAARYRLVESWLRLVIRCGLMLKAQCCGHAGLVTAD